jgi:hypothetical protein
MPRIPLRARIGLIAAGVAVLAGAPAAGAMTVLYDRADAVAAVLAARPDGHGLTARDDLIQQGPVRRVLPGSRLAWKVSGRAGTRATPSILGRGPKGMADLLRDRIRRSGAHLVFLDDLGPQFKGKEGSDLERALAQLQDETAPYAPDGLAHRVHIYVPDPGVILADVSEWRAARQAILRSGGVWLEAYHGREQWAPEEWYTLPGEFVRRVRAGAGSIWQVHVLMRGGPGLADSWAYARRGATCSVLMTGPGGYRLGEDGETFVREFRRTFPLGPPNDVSKGGPVGCGPAPAITQTAAAGLASAYGMEATGLEIPPGGLVTPPLPAGEPAQLTLQLGSDPLGLAPSFDMTPEDFLTKAGLTVVATGPGFSVEAPIEGDGAARLSFTPTAPGPVTMRVVVTALSVRRASGHPVDVLPALRAAGAPATFVRGVIARPAGWRIDVPLQQPGNPPGSPVLQIVSVP